MSKFGAVRIVSTGPSRTRITLSETGEDLKGVQALTLEMSADSKHTATLTLKLIEVEAEAEARARYVMIDNMTGKSREVAKIVWADGGTTDLD